MAAGHEDREHILRFNLAGIRAKVAELANDEVLMLLDLTDRIGRTIFKAIRMNQGLSAADADQEISVKTLHVGTDHLPIMWLHVPFEMARDLAQLSAGTPANFDSAAAYRQRNQHVVSVVSANGNLYTVI